MARLIVDTSVLIEAERGLGSLDRLASPGDEVAVAAISVAELLVGVLLADRRNRRRRASFAETVVSAIPIEAYDLDVARAHAELIVRSRRTGTARSAHDLIIAATARARGRAVLTIDARGFEDLPGVEVRALR